MSVFKTFPKVCPLDQKPCERKKCETFDLCDSVWLVNCMCPVNGCECDLLKDLPKSERTPMFCLLNCDVEDYFNEVQRVFYS